MADRGKKCPVPANSTPAWMTTFGDMNNLLLVFFIAMLTNAEVEGRELQLILSAFEGNFGMNTGGNTLSPGPLAEGGDSLEQLPARDYGNRLSKAFKELSQVLKPELRSRQVRVDETQKGLKITLSSDVFFRPGAAGIDFSAAREIIRKIGMSLRDLNSSVRVEVVGHTDNTPVAKNSMYTSNWELSTARACTIVRYLSSYGVSPSIMYAEGKGEYEPLESNDSPDKMAYNRRIEIFIAPVSR